MSGNNGVTKKFMVVPTVVVPLMECSAGTSSARSTTNINQTFYQFTSRREKRDTLIKLIELHDNQRIIVFVNGKKAAQSLACALAQLNVPTVSVHNGISSKERERAIEDLVSGRHRVLLTTSYHLVSAVTNVDLIINYDLPKDIATYKTRIGLKWRSDGIVISFYDESENSDFAAGLVEYLRQAKQQIPDFLSSKQQ